MNLRSILAVAVLCALPGDLPAQATPSPNGDRLRCTTDSLEIYLVRQSERRRTGTVVDECHASGTGASRLITRVYRSTDALLGNRLDTIVDLWTSLHPQSYHSTSSRETLRLDWADGKIRGQIQNGGTASAVDERAPAASYNGASFDVILRASPLALRYVVAVPAFVPGRGIVTLTAKVVGEESIDGQSTWRVDADFTGMAVSFWIAQRSRRLLKQVMHVAPGTDVEFIAPATRRS